MAGMTRLSTTQLGWRPLPAEADPYGDVFDRSAARAYSRSQIDSHAGLVARAGALGAGLTVTGEAIDGTERAMTYLDDPTLFATLVAETSVYVHETMAALAKQNAMYVVACFYEAQDGAHFNSAVLWGRDGAVIGRYHKVNLPIYEAWQVQCGDGFPVFDTDIAPVGMLICYDEMWPEAMAALAVNGARIVCHPSAASPPDWKCKTRAMDAQAFYVTSTGVGSRITAPDAVILADAEQQACAVVTADVDVAGATLAPEGYWEYIYSGVQCHRERHLRLRQSAAYGVLSEVSPPAVRELPREGLNDTPQRIRAAYERQKAEYERLRRGEPARYHWRWSGK